MLTATDAVERIVFFEVLAHAFEIRKDRVLVDEEAIEVIQNLSPVVLMDLDFTNYPWTGVHLAEGIQGRGRVFSRIARTVDGKAARLMNQTLISIFGHEGEGQFQIFSAQGLSVEFGFEDLLNLADRVSGEKRASQDVHIVRVRALLHRRAEKRGMVFPGVENTDLALFFPAVVLQGEIQGDQR